MNTSMAIGSTVSTRPDSRGLNKAGGMVFMWELVVIQGWAARLHHLLQGPSLLLSCGPHGPYVVRCCARSLRCVWLFVTPWTVAYQAPLSVGILQARILEWVTMPSSRGSSQTGDRIQVSCIAGRFFTVWATKQALKVLTKNWVEFSMLYCRSLLVIYFIHSIVYLLISNS